MVERTITCIACPRGCRLLVSGDAKDDDGTGLVISGNRCPKGRDYALQEVRCPVRVLTSTVATTGIEQPRLPVKTSGEIPREFIFPAMRAIRKITLTEPKIPGEIVVSDFLSRGIDLISTGEWDGR